MLSAHTIYYSICTLPRIYEIPASMLHTAMEPGHYMHLYAYADLMPIVAARSAHVGGGPTPPASHAIDGVRSSRPPSVQQVTHSHMPHMAMVLRSMHATKNMLNAMKSHWHTQFTAARESCPYRSKASSNSVPFARYHPQPLSSMNRILMEIN